MLKDMLLTDYDIIEIITRILVAYIMGIFIVWERSQHGKPIGSRTTSIVCMSAAILSCYEEVFAKSIILINEELIKSGRGALYKMPDYNRISAQIVSGICFLGAGMIIQNRGKLHGITTAAIVWTTACLGIVIGSGQWALSAIGCVCIFLSTSIYRFFVPYFLSNKKKSVYYLVEYSSKTDIESDMAKFGIKLNNIKVVGWKEASNINASSNKENANPNKAPNIISKIDLLVPKLDYKNIENILMCSDIKPIKLLKNMREKIDDYEQH